MTAVPDRIVVASHLTPCGRSWVDNLLVCLNVKWSYTDYFDHWVHIWEHDAAQQAFRYRHRDQPQPFIKKYCPAMLAQEWFRFAPGKEAISTHSLPRSEWRDCKKIYVVRDFRNVMVSGYKRRKRNPGVFTDFLQELDPDWLLPIYLGMQYHVESWLAQPNVLLVRHEDCRRDGAREIGRIIEFLELDVSEAERAAALASCASYTPGPVELEPDWEAAVAQMEAICQPTRLRLGYCDAAARHDPEAARQAREFVALCRACGLFNNFQAWDGIPAGGLALADPPADAAAGTDVAPAVADTMASWQRWLDPVLKGLLNLRLGAEIRTVYGQPLGLARGRGSPADAMRFASQAGRLIAEISGALVAEFSDTQPHHVSMSPRNLLLAPSLLVADGWHFSGLTREEAGPLPGLPDLPGLPFARHLRVKTEGDGMRRMVMQTVPVRDGCSHFCFSVHACAGTLKDIGFQFAHAKAWCGVYFDVARGYWYAMSATRGCELLRARMTPLEHGWYRLEASFRFLYEIDSVLCRMYVAQNAGVLDFAGQDGGALALFGAQLERGDRATPYGAPGNE